MNQIIFTFLLIILSLHGYAARITGTIKDTKGSLLSFASITLKGTSRGAAANSQGMYSIDLRAGSYTLVCQYVGYQAIEKKITVGNEDLTVDFVLELQALSMDEVIIKKGEDPALEIMRQTIKKRNYYNNQVDSFQVEVYIKGLMRTRSVPDKFMGQKIEREDMARDGIDSAGKGILFLSESVTKVSYAKPDKIKMNVISSRESGGGYGISFPFFINMYESNVSVFSNSLNPRGFISPLSDNALHYYRFNYEGNFFEGDKMIDRIRVTPRRKHEPLFQGYLQIVDGEWRIHSLDLMTTKQYQLELIDTLQIRQIHAPVTSEVWRTQNQVVYLSAGMFGFDITGNFLNVYSQYDLDPGFTKKHFNRILMSYDSNANRKDSSYWANVRPVPLEPDEKRNYVFKDSIRQADRDSFSRLNIDSLRKRQKPVKPLEFFWGGANHTFYGRSAYTTWSFTPLLKNLEYNTVEGLVAGIRQTLDIRRRKGKHFYSLESYLRYGFSNEHVNGHLSLTVKPKRNDYRNRQLVLSGGKRVSQFNQDNPIDALTNSLYTLFSKRNYMKIYENWFGAAGYGRRFENGFRMELKATWEDRTPLSNSTSYNFSKSKKPFTPNHPYELEHIEFKRHQASVVSAMVSYQPGMYYIQYPHGKVPIGSKYPVLELNYTKGIKGLLSSDINFDKWNFAVYDNMNFKLGGEFRYRIGVGGFVNADSVSIPDLQHFNGNQTFYNVKYLNSFQLAPYYRYSNKERLYSVLHVEHHFNGLLTNKIPLFNRLKWHLVGGMNSFYVNRDNYYVEVFAGLENIAKMFRVDFVTAYQAQPGNSFGIRIGLGGIIGGAFRMNAN